MVLVELGRIRDEALVLIDLLKVEFRRVGDSVAAAGRSAEDLDLVPEAAATEVEELEATRVWLSFFERCLGDLSELGIITTLGLLTPVELVGGLAPLVTCFTGSDIFLVGGLGGRAEVKDLIVDSLLVGTEPFPGMAGDFFALLEECCFSFLPMRLVSLLLLPLLALSLALPNFPNSGEDLEAANSSSVGRENAS